jgi:hypothetical protein
VVVEGISVVVVDVDVVFGSLDVFGFLVAVVSKGAIVVDCVIFLL